MPQISRQVVSVEPVDIGFDAEGNEVQIGDFVTIKLKVTLVKPIIDSQIVDGNGKHPEIGQLFELGRIRDNGSLEHFLVCDGKWCHKVR